MDVAFGVATNQRTRGNLPPFRLVNMFVEAAATEPNGVTLHSRPGLEDNEVDSGSDPVIGIFQKDGVLSGDLFTVTRGATTRLYRDGVFQATLTGAGPVSMAGNEIGLAINAGGPVYYHGGTTVTEADFPDDANVCKVLEIAGRFIALRSGTQKFYWTLTLETAIVNDLLTFDALDFASAENEPDQLVDATVVDDILVLGGKQTVEFWQKSGDESLPFVPIAGRVYTKGVRETGCMVSYADSAAFISSDNIVYRTGNAPERISTPGVEERLAGSATASAFTFFHEGHEWLIVRTDTTSEALDGEWTQFASRGETNWICRCAVSGPIFGASDGKTLVFGDTHSDLGEELERRFTAGISLSGGNLAIDNLRLRTNPGQTTYLSGQYADPVIEVRTSRDGGLTWGNFRPAKLGQQGEYRRNVEWRALGSFVAPGAMFDFRCTDPVPLRISGVVANEAMR